MSDPEEEPADPVKVKQVAISAGIVTAALTAAVAFTVAGPLGVGLAAAGVAGTGYTVHRIRNPRKGTLLHSLLTRPRSSKSTGGNLTWPFTGNQSRRALSKSGGSGKTRASKPITGTGFRGTRSGSATRKATSGLRTGGSRGSLLPKTTHSRAARSAGGALPKHRTSRPVPSRTTGRPSASKPAGVRTPKTATRTPAKLSTRKPLGSGRPSPLNRTGSKSPSKRAGIGRPGSSTLGRFSTRSPRSGKWRVNPFLGTRGGRSLGGRSTATRRAKRLGGTLGATPRAGRLGRLRHRVTPDRNRNTAPNRTRLRPRPYARRTAGQLLRTSLRLPVLRRSTRGSRRVVAPLKLPSKRQAKRARRTLRLRSGVWVRRGGLWVFRSPARWWDKLWLRLPKAPMPLSYYTERAGMKAPTGPKTLTIPTPPQPPLATVIPINRKAVTQMSNPNSVIADAFQQMASFQPESARDVEVWLQEQQDLMAQIGATYGVLADRMRDGMPFASPVTDSVREIGVAIGAVGGIAQAAHQTLRVAHESDIRRYEDPRPNEDMWNPERNR